MIIPDKLTIINVEVIAVNSIADFAAGKTRLAKYAAEGAAEKRKRNAALAFCGLLVGLVNGFLGAGGGMLAVPVLTFAAALPEKKAHATAIALILPLCAVSAAVYAIGGAGEYLADLPAAAGVFAGGIAGALLLKKASPELLTELFYGVMLFAGVKIIFGS